MQNRFIVTSKAEWKQHELKELLKDIKGMPGEDECKVLISSRCVGSDFGDVKELLPENTVLAAIPYESNPFYPGKACRQIFLNFWMVHTRKKNIKGAILIETAVFLEGRGTLKNLGSG